MARGHFAELDVLFRTAFAAPRGNCARPLVEGDKF